MDPLILQHDGFNGGITDAFNALKWKTRRPESENVSFLESVAVIDPNTKLNMLVLKPPSQNEKKIVYIFSILQSFKLAL